LALSIIHARLCGIELGPALHAVEALGAKAFADFLCWHKLAPIWCEILEGSEARAGVDRQLLEALRNDRRRVAAGYLAQKAALTEIDRRFGEAGIIYTAIKGAHVREVVYTNPSLRSAADIDLLVAPHQRVSAASTLMRAGFTLVSNIENMSHEATLS